MSFARGVATSMKRFSAVVLLCGSVVTYVTLEAQLRAQSLPPAGVGAPAQNLSQGVADRSRELSQLFNDIWQDKLKHQPEYATYLGDKRYDAELTDYSPRAVNDALARGRTFIDRLSKIDTTGLPQHGQLSACTM